jgi:Ca-activated chloride channel family protein
MKKQQAPQNNDQPKKEEKMKAMFLISVAAVLLVFSALPSSPAAVHIELDLDKPVVSSGKVETVVLKIGLEADGIPERAGRLPLNLVLVLDKSGSMGGRKIEDAKEAAIEVVRRLDKNDIFSRVVFETNPRVIIPARYLTDRNSVIETIRGIRAGGSTALYGGLNLGAAEARKNINNLFTPRIILLSDGLANVGPRTTAELARLGAELGREGMTVTTVGLGLDYNEDLMTALAESSDANAYFARHSRELPRIFAEEIGDATTLAARNLKVRIKCPSGVIPRALLGRKGLIRKQTVEVELKNLYANGSKYILLEVGVPSGHDGSEIKLASVTLDYEDVFTEKKVSSNKSVLLRYCLDEEEVEESKNRGVMKELALTRVSLAKKEALDLSDKGDYKAAAGVMKEKQKLLEEVAAECGNDEDLLREAKNCDRFSSTISREKGLSKYGRKRIMNEAYIQMNQQRYESR